MRTYLSRLPEMGWYLAALVGWGGLVLSLPGYYLWFVEQPLRLGYEGLAVGFAIVIGLASLLCALVSLALATLVFLRKPGDRAALYVSYYLLSYGLVMAGPLEWIEYLLTGQTGEISFQIQAVVFIPLTLFLLLTFPNGVITPARFRWLVPWILALTLVMAFLTPGEHQAPVTARSVFAYANVGVLFILTFGGQVYRYLKKSSLVERQQTKIVVYGIGLQFLMLLALSAIFFQRSPEQQGAMLPEFLLTDLGWFIAITVLPVSLTLAVIRSRLWDIDVVIRRTLIYGFLTAVLALVYFGGVILMQYAFRLFAGHESPAAVVLSTLVIAGLFQPLRGRIQALIDRRFYRSKYNAEQALDRFQKSMRDRVDLDQLERELAGIIQITVQPEWMAVWMRKGEEDRQ